LAVRGLAQSSPRMMAQLDPLWEWGEKLLYWPDLLSAVALQKRRDYRSIMHLRYSMKKYTNLSGSSCASHT
jgi:hypothetical protein